MCAFLQLGTLVEQAERDPPGSGEQADEQARQRLDQLAALEQPDRLVAPGRERRLSAAKAHSRERHHRCRKVPREIEASEKAQKERAGDIGDERAEGGVRLDVVGEGPRRSAIFGLKSTMTSDKGHLRERGGRGAWSPERPCPSTPWSSVAPPSRAFRARAMSSVASG